ncbi:sulfur oxidation c-type cytochrome SoxA [Rhodobacter sp. NTK016B]|uniref:sulfur oxidation c-type cytochrome SoxA n=1 Tax=Rhodobacter sp. NTK016B TaxID=2759676 RepID=UPI001A8F4DB5|nr:sulfur oxidation c-type cytochrome SoxA [Rhodobacter sp. NTK016B]MBN8293931.1 sulfur oxidation c-type cytochrome SoxA [Rhodobacter sp. NTK016B]
MQHLKPAKSLALASACVAALWSGAAMADPDPTAELLIDGEIPITVRAPSDDGLTPYLPERYSGWLFRSAETRSLQADDFENPAMLAVEVGAELWETADGSAGQSCMDCHGDAEESMAGVRARMPHVNDNGELWSMENYINNCRTERMGAEEWRWSGDEMTSMTSFISLQSRGMPVAVQIDGPAAPYWEQGQEIYYTRFGQLELSCASCHEESYGLNIRADHLSQGQITGFPTYRLKNAGMVSIHNRFRGCIRDTRAETFAEGSEEFRALELYVASRGMGLDIEGVSVRP